MNIRWRVNKGMARAITRSLVVLFSLLGFVILLSESTVAAPVSVDSPVVAGDTTSETANSVTYLAQVSNLPQVEIDSGITTTATTHLPMVSYMQQLSTRLGAAELMKPIDWYPDVGTLRMGWYLDWRTTLNPPRPGGMEYAQMIRVHQNIDCPVGTTPDRVVCPYSVPHSYSYTPDATTIAQIAQANPGSLWLIGNEMDRMDWFGSHQDEMLPEMYAVAFHDLQSLIRGADPKAQIAIGGIVQPSPLRLEYLTKVWDTYQQTYGQPMPVDVWNTHAFILREKKDEWGASIPPGSTATVGAHDYGPLPHTQHVDIDIFDQQIRAFRQWMKDHGQQEKPFIVTEFGVLYKNWMLGVPDNDSQTTIDFMLETFDYLLNTADCSLGYTADGCRLVQRWVWFSMDYTLDFNEFHYLFDPITKQITDTGKAFRDFSLQNINALSQKPY